MEKQLRLKFLRMSEQNVMSLYYLTYLAYLLGVSSKRLTAAIFSLCFIKLAPSILEFQISKRIFMNISLTNYDEIFLTFHFVERYSELDQQIQYIQVHFPSLLLFTQKFSMENSSLAQHLFHRLGKYWIQINILCPEELDPLYQQFLLQILQLFQKISDGNVNFKTLVLSITDNKNRNYELHADIISILHYFKKIEIIQIELGFQVSLKAFGIIYNKNSDQNITLNIQDQEARNLLISEEQIQETDNQESYLRELKLDECEVYDPKLFEQFNRIEVCTFYQCYLSCFCFEIMKSWKNLKSLTFIYGQYN